MSSVCIEHQSEWIELKADDHRVAHLSWHVRPSQVREVRVGRAGDQFDANLSELLGTVAERDDLGRAHEGAAGDMERERRDGRLEAMVIRMINRNQDDQQFYNESIG